MGQDRGMDLMYHYLCDDARNQFRYLSLRRLKILW